MAPSNGSTSTPPKSSPYPPNIAHHNDTLRWHPAMAARPLPQSWSSGTLQGTQQRQHVQSPKLGHHYPPNIAHHNGTLRWHPAMAARPYPNHSTPQWHPTMAPSNGSTSTPPKSSPYPPNIAHHDGTQQWQHVHSLKVGRHPLP